MLRRHMVSIAAVLALFTSAEAHATWKLYGSMDVGYSIGKGEVSGDGEFVLPFELSGSDKDVSPLLGGAIGIEVPLTELTPWRLPDELYLPAWPFRFEIEAAGLREYDLATPALVDGEYFNTQVKTWSMMGNFWFDVPLGGLHRPLIATARLLKQRTYFPDTKRFLDAATWYVGFGVGLGSVEASTASPNFTGNDQKYNFAYQVGTGFGYQATKRINLSIGYRYYNPGDIDLELYQTGVDDPFGTMELSTNVHEVRFSVRVNLYDLPYPWRR